MSDPAYPHPQPVVAENATPTLTDAEREAVDTAEASLMRESTDLSTPLPVRQRLGAAAATLRGLLERSAGAHKITETATASAADAAKRHTNQPRKGALRHE